MESRAPAVSPDKVAIYIRWSTEDQGEGTTLDVQLEGCRHYLLSQGWTVRADLIFIDDGYSGATLERPALGRLREQVRAGKVECTVVYKLDRLSRSVADTARLCMDEWEGVCCVRSAREPIDTASQAGRMFFYTLMNYAEWERSVIRDRTYSGRIRRAQEGRDPGVTVPYGYAKDPATGRFVTVAHEAAVVRRIFAAYRLGAGLLRLTEQLNGEAIPFRGGRQWQAQTVGYILSNRAYVGDLVWGRRTTNLRYGRREGEPRRTDREEPLVVTPGVYPPIITAAEFDQVQQIRRQRPCRRRGSGGRSLNSPYLLTGLLRCAGCGAPMVGRHNDPDSPTGYYYACLGRQAKGRGACAAAAIPCHALDGLVAEQLRGLYGDAEARRQCLSILTADAGQRLAAARAERGELARQLDRLVQRERRIGQEYADQRITLDEFRLLRETLRPERAALEAGLSERTATVAALAAEAGGSTGLTARIGGLDPWLVLTAEHRKQVLRHFVHSIAAWKTDGELRCAVGWNVAANDEILTAPSKFRNKA